MKKLKKFTTFEALKSWERKPVKSDADLEKHAALGKFIEEIKSIQKKEEKGR